MLFLFIVCSQLAFFYTIRSLKPHRNLLVSALIGKYVLNWVNEGQATVVYPVSQGVTL